jgi:hypothetical protein
MIRLFLVASFILALLLAACTPGGESTTPTGAPATPSRGALPTVSTPGGGYPAPPTATLPAPGYPGGQPVLPTHAYPVEGELWIVHAAGEQCEDALTYPDLEAAEQALEDAGVTVLDSETIDLIVCSACGCPTSLHYRVLINATDLTAALALEWTVEQE